MKNINFKLISVLLSVAVSFLLIAPCCTIAELVQQSALKGAKSHLCCLNAPLSKSQSSNAHQCPLSENGASADPNCLAHKYFVGITEKIAQNPVHFCSTETHPQLATAELFVSILTSSGNISAWLAWNKAFHHHHAEQIRSILRI